MINREGFDRDARLLVEWAGNHSDKEVADEARQLADDYGIGHDEIWDILPEYAE